MAAAAANAGKAAHHIVIVGGGAGGLALATKLGRQVGGIGLANITLVDSSRTHVWKPLLHQLAAGSFDTHAEEIEYLAQARWNHFKFRLGSLQGIDRAAKRLQLAASYDDGGREITPAQSLSYDTLVLAIGSQTNDFGTKGAAANTIKLDTPQAARQFNDRLINACIRAQTVPRVPGSGRLTVTIVGAGATGVELAAELHAAARVLANFGFDNIHPEKDLQIVLVEAAPRVLSQLPERLSTAAVRELRKLAVEVHTNERVVEVTPDSVKMASGRVIQSSLTVWAAGIKASSILCNLGTRVVQQQQQPGSAAPSVPSAALGGGTTTAAAAPIIATDADNSQHVLECNRLNQLVVNGNLQTTRDPSIYAFGDCAACPQPNGGTVPPRAQSAYQQAMYLNQHLPDMLGLGIGNQGSQGRQSKQAVPAFVFRDQGSLVSLAEYSSVGSLMGSLTKGSLFVEGAIAKFMYWALHKQHQLALGGWRKTALVTMSELIDRTHRPRIKLH